MKALKLTIIVALVATLFALSPVGFSYPEGNADNFVGVGKCKMCHKHQYEKWLDMKHSGAFAVLETEAADKLGVEKGMLAEGEKASESPKCLKCHVTGYDVETQTIAKKIEKKKAKYPLGVQCESCHGAGKEYAKKPVMKDREKSLAAGLVLPTEEVCVQCHNEESPSYEPFDFEERYAKIAHKTPEKK